ncbi:uncharacterized protein [Medicago truncatula]|uniref:uncharacterized protein n=1 Tax=Medicago truncatula TaxID=3880 RepID=UPI00196751E9|nr:uncharacterized protein LOC112417366 [Medicago truncatula]
MTQTFLKTLKKDYVERMIIAAPSDFSEMVTMGTRLEEAVRDGIIVFEKCESSANASRKYGNGHHKKKETEVGMVSAGTSQSMATVAPINAAQLPPPYQYMQYSQHPFFPPFYHQYPPSPGQPQVPVNAIAQQMQQQPLAQQQQQQTRPTFPPIPMLYAELLPTLLLKGHCTTRQGKPPPNPLPPRFRCYALKYIVKKLIDQGKLTFENNVPHVLDNPLPNHAAVNMIETHEEVPSLDVRNVATPLNDIQSLMNDNYLTISDICVIVPVFHDPPAKSMPPKGSIEPLVIRLLGPVPYTSTKAIPYKYNATTIENGVEVPLASSTVIRNIAEETTTLRSGKVRPPLFPKKTAIPTAIPSDKVPPPDVSRPGQSIEDSNLDEILRLIKRSDYKIVDQLLQTPSKISILSLLLSSAAHRNTLLKVLEQAYVDHEVTVDHFGSIVGNITACNNLWFGEDELPEAGKYHNLALHISMNCKSDMLSNVLVDTGSSLNVMPKSTLDQLSYRGTPLRRSTFLVKAFDGSRSAEGTAFQGLTIEGTEPKRAGAAMASLKDAQRAVLEGQATGWEGKAIQPHQEEIEIINLGTKENKREIKVGAALEKRVKKKIFQLLREYPDIFAWSYEDMSGLDPKIVEHRIPTKPESLPLDRN